MTAAVTPTANPSLATAIQKARDASMPKDNIQRAIDRGTGAGSDGEAIERIVFEGYGPGGAAVLVEALTDNRNRTSADVRHAFTRHGGSLGEPGSVAWIFEKRGAVVVDGARYGEDDLIAGDRRGRRGRAGGRRHAAGPQRAQRSDRGARGASGRGRGDPVRRAGDGAEEHGGGERRRMPPSCCDLLEDLSEHDDVSEVHANFDIPEEILERRRRSEGIRASSQNQLPCR